MNKKETVTVEDLHKALDLMGRTGIRYWLDGGKLSSWACAFLWRNCGDSSFCGIVGYRSMSSLPCS